MLWIRLYLQKTLLFIWFALICFNVNFLVSFAMIAYANRLYVIWTCTECALLTTFSEWQMDWAFWMKVNIEFSLRLNMFLLHKNETKKLFTSIIVMLMCLVQTVRIGWLIFIYLFSSWVVRSGDISSECYKFDSFSLFLNFMVGLWMFWLHLWFYFILRHFQ